MQTSMPSSHLECLLSNMKTSGPRPESEVVPIHTIDDSEDMSVSKLARAFFIATTKESEDDEDILPQVKIISKHIILQKKANILFL